MATAGRRRRQAGIRRPLQHARVVGQRRRLAKQTGSTNIRYNICEPAFEHYPATDIPELEIAGTTVRVLMGEAYGHASPVKSYSPMVYLEYRLPKGAYIELPTRYREIAAYVVAEDVQIDQRSLTSGVMAVAQADTTVQIKAKVDSHVLVIGGDPIGKRHIWWNFVSSSAKRIEKAKADWTQGRFPPVPGESEFIPLPD